MSEHSPEKSHTVFIDTETNTYKLDGQELKDWLELDLHIGQDRYVTIKYFVE